MLTSGTGQRNSEGPLSPDAICIITLFGSRVEIDTSQLRTLHTRDQLVLNGMHIRIPKQPSNDPALLIDVNWYRTPLQYRSTSAPLPPFIVARGLAMYIQCSHWFTKLSEYKHAEGCRNGWREAGYDGDVADWYVPTQ